MKRRFFPRTLQKSQTPEGQARSQPALSTPVCLERAGERRSWRGGQGPVATHPPGTPGRGVRRKREVREKLKAQTCRSDYFGFGRQRSKPKRECVGLCNWKVRTFNHIIRIFFLLLHPYTQFFFFFLCWLQSLTESFHMLASGNASFMMNK